jgi:hypothetical protein
MPEFWDFAYAGIKETQAYAGIIRLRLPRFASEGDLLDVDFVKRIMGLENLHLRVMADGEAVTRPNLDL